jgi:hypothetical protein
VPSGFAAGSCAKTIAPANSPPKTQTLRTS